MAGDMKRVGEILKSRRKDKNLSLKEVENATSIRSFYLEAIESGTIAEHIAPIYVQGFIKQYASFLSLEVDRLIEENREAFEMPMAKPEFAYGIGTLEVRGSQGSGIKWIPHFLWALLSASLLVLGWYAAKFLGIL